jgi:succinate dehydrogenase / fumarate reductase membrane anchor subunit
MQSRDTRSPLRRAAGLGSAKKGFGHWWAVRISAVALIPLTLWFFASVVTLGGSDYLGLVTWLKAPLPAVCMGLLLLVLFYHMALGLQVIVEDYVHSRARFPILIVVRLTCFALAATGIFAILRISFGG